ncbi:MAG: molecular chaperone TorD family protein [Thiohalocapsa sp.]|jgi:TorA maturation chaperone TorD
MRSATALRDLDFDELFILSGLLQVPGNIAKEFVLDVGQSWAWLREAVRDLQGMSLDEWQREYVELFLRRGTEISCPPYESDYCVEDPADACAVRLAEIHMLAGVPVSNMPPDYIGSELRLLAQLLEYDTQADPALAEELWGRLRAWVPRFAADLEQRSRLSLYRALGRRLAQIFTG